MRVLVAPDKFKGSLSSKEVCSCIRSGLEAALVGAEILTLPLADGGEGLADVLAFYGHYGKVRLPVCGPLWHPLEAGFLFDATTGTAIIEMARASGLQLLAPGACNPAQTTTYGTGQLIGEALRMGARKLIIGLGGSATNDCGIGMAAALGYRFLDATGVVLEPIGANLGKVAYIDASNAFSFEHLEVWAACDVTNLLTGSHGATHTFGPQKGATPALVESLEAGMVHFAELLRSQLGVDVRHLQGGGAAGGMGAGCHAFLGASICSGTDLVLSASNAAALIRSADLVVSGEGKLDGQTWNGKLVHGVAAMCREANKPLYVFCGILDCDADELRRQGISAVYPLLTGGLTLPEAMKDAGALLRQKAFALGGSLQKDGALP